MKIALIFEPDLEYSETLILSLFLIENIKELSENKYIISLFTNYPDLFKSLSHNEPKKTQNYLKESGSESNLNENIEPANNTLSIFPYKSLKEIIFSDYQIIHNLFNQNIALCSSFFSKELNFINTVDKLEFESDFFKYLPCKRFFTINYSEFCNKDIYQGFLPFQLSRKRFNKVTSDYFLILLPENIDIQTGILLKKLISLNKIKYLVASETKKALLKEYLDSKSHFLSKSANILSYLSNSDYIIDLADSYFFREYARAFDIPVFFHSVDSSANSFQSFEDLLPKLSEPSSYLSEENISGAVLDKFYQGFSISKNKKPVKLKISFYIDRSSFFDARTPLEKGLGGTESALVYMARQLAKLGHQVNIFNQTNNPGIYENVHYHSSRDFSGYIMENPCDILISIRSHILYKDIKCKALVFWTEDDFNQSHSISFAENSQYGELVDKIFVVSNYHKKMFMKRYQIADNKFYVTRNGINPEFFPESKRREKYKLVYTSTPFRGLEILLELFPKIRENVPEAVLEVYSSMTLYGLSEKDDDNNFGELYEKMRNTEGIRLMKPVPQPELAKALSEAYLMTYPNIFPETSCISALEAQAAGLPVITSRLGALAETVSDNFSGICLAEYPGSEEYKKAFVETVTEFLTNHDKWQSFSDNARKRMMDSFSWETIAREWQNEFSDLVSEYEILRGFYRFFDKLENIGIPEYHLYKFVRTDFYNTKLLYWELELLERFYRSKLTDILKADSLLRQANIYNLLKNSEQADQKYFQAFELFFRLGADFTKIQYIDYAFYRVISFYQDKSPENSEKLCRYMLNLLPDSYFINLKFADFLILNRSYIDAIRVLNKCLASFNSESLPNWIPEKFIPELPYFGLIHCYYNLNDYKKVLFYIKKLDKEARKEQSIINILNKIADSGYLKAE